MPLSPKSLVRSAKTVSSLPMVFTRLNDAVNDPRSSARDIANIISDDAALAARLLRLSNSAFYSFPSKIDTISRSVTLIGTRELRDLALATSVLQMFEGMSDDLVTMESFWRHSISCGIGARILATYRREPNVESFFVSGLLHDIGRLIMFMQIPDKAREAFAEAEKRGELLFKMEKEIIGFDHAAVGSALLQQWQLPDTTVNAVALHHRPSRGNNLNMQAAIVHLADLIANAVQWGSSGERLVPPLDQQAWDKLELSASVLSPTLNQLEVQYEEAVSFLLPSKES